jgi:protein-L-isoaspartate(D-aspartate) O-methyltransferase
MFFSIRESEKLFTIRRCEMVEVLKRYGIGNQSVLDAFLQVERHRFFPEDAQDLAYNDAAYPIGFRQTISQPYTVAYMTELLVDRCPSGRVLEIGTGSGYQSAILEALGYSVFTVERVLELFEHTEKLFTQLGLNVACRYGDGTLGWKEEAPFDGIVVTAGAKDVPPSLCRQLADNGCMVIPLGSHVSQQMTVVRRVGDDFRREVFQQFVFVPLTGREGWNENE